MLLICFAICITFRISWQLYNFDLITSFIIENIKLYLKIECQLKYYIIVPQNEVRELIKDINYFFIINKYLLNSTLRY